MKTKYKKNGEMKVAAHKARHLELHRAFDELTADYLSQNDKSLSETSIMELIKWSYQQTQKPTNNKL